MKNLLLFLSLSTAFLVSSCTKETVVVEETIEEQLFLAKTFEVTTTMDFNSNANLYQTGLFTFPFDVFESDAVLAYRLEFVDDGFDVWTQLPHNFYLDNGEVIQYVHRHTFVDVEVLLDGNYEPSTLPLEFTDNQTFRFVVVPSEFANAKMTMDEAIETFGLQY